MNQDIESDLTTAEVARKTGLSKSTVNELCRERIFPEAYKKAGAWRIPQSNVNDWISKQNKLSNRLNRSTAPEKWEKFRNRPWVFWPTIILTVITTTILFLNSGISAGADFKLFQEQLYEWGIIHPFSSRDEDEILIVIATFNSGTDRAESDIQQQLGTAIQEQVSELKLQNIRVEIDPAIITAIDRQGAQKLGEQYKATIIIWGDDTDFQIQTNFLNITDNTYDLSDLSLSELERTSLAAPSEYVQFVNTELEPQITFSALFAIGKSYLANGNYSEVISILEYTLTNYQKNLNSDQSQNLDEVWFALGSAYQAQGNSEQAIANYTYVIEQDPNNYGALNNRGNTFRSIGNLDKAISDFTDAIKINPEFFLAYSNRGNTYIDQENFELAINDFNRSIELSPSNSFNYVWKGNAYSKMGDFELALNAYNLGIQLDPYNPGIFLNRGNIHDNLGNYKQAIADFEYAIQLNPEYPDPYNNRGKIYFDQGDLESAIADFDYAIQLNPEYPEAYFNRGSAYLKQHDFSNAIEDLENAIQLEPNYANSYHQLGFAYQQQGELEKATTNFQYFLKLNPESPNREILEFLILSNQEKSEP